MTPSSRHSMTVLPSIRPPLACERVQRVAESLQNLLLRTCPDGSLHGVSVESVYEAALDEAVVGGDSCDAFALPCGRVALVVADASGKGLAAAERVAEVRFGLRAFLCEHGNPALALSCLNNYIYDAQRMGRHEVDSFITLTMVVLDCGTGRALCLCAGGEPPLILRGYGAIEEVDISGPALGLLKGAEYEATLVRVDQNDSILMFTDGITEARPRRAGAAGGVAGQSAFLGLSGLAQLATEALGTHEPTMRVAGSGQRGPSNCIGRRIFEGARAFAGGVFQDDACLLIARRALS